jgi:hypothetical protein
MITLIALLAFSSIDEAAVAALTESKYHCSQQYECGGYIFQGVDGRYNYTPPMTSHRPSSLDMTAVYVTRHDWVADYHTHPCVGVTPLNEVFSFQDVMSNKGLHFPGYMLSLCSGYVRRWAEGDPEDDFEVDYTSGRKLFLAAGHIVGVVP